MALHFVDGIGNALIKQLILHCGSAKEVFNQSGRELLSVPGIREIVTQSIRSQSPMQRAEEEWRKAESHGVQILFFTDAGYPGRLKLLDDGPSMLYVKGNTNLNTVRTIGVVGTRRATSYGKECVEQLIADLVPYQAHIISGLAYGIDVHAHKEALRHGLTTLAILGSGLDIIYPSDHRDTAARIESQGALITEKPYGTMPDAHNFPQRNRIIAGMSDALVVVEASEKGGALITAEIANSYNRDVFAIPGNIDNPYSIGCNRLIKSHKANLLTTVKDLEYIMNWTEQSGQTITQLQLALDNLEPEEQRVVNILRQKNRAVAIDELCFLTQQPQGILASILLTLEFKNIVVAHPGKMFSSR